MDCAVLCFKGVLYSAWWWCAVSVSVACVLFAVLLARSDCDLLLAFYSRWGKKQLPSVLYGKVVWVTGASSGLGQEFCYFLSKCGAIVVLSARREEELQRVLKRCIELSPASTKNKHMVLPMDLMETDKHAGLAATVTRKFGKIDYLVNNCGQSQRAGAIATELAVTRAIIDLNVVGTISLTKAVLPGMAEHREGCIVVISSVAGKFGTPKAASYSASKHALMGYFSALRVEVADKNISVLCVCPGLIVTPGIHTMFAEKLSAPIRIPPWPYGLSMERCTYLLAVTMVNKLEEAWITKHPMLFLLYLDRISSSLSAWCRTRIMKRMVKMNVVNFGNGKAK